MEPIVDALLNEPLTESVSRERVKTIKRFIEMEQAGQTKWDDIDVRSHYKTLRSRLEFLKKKPYLNNYLLAERAALKWIVLLIKSAMEEVDARAKISVSEKE